VPIPTRRFGRTELAMPLLSLGGMRFQQSWSDLPADQISAESQANLRRTLERAVAHGLHHIETARHYGTSERQLGWLLPDCPDPERLLQTKVPPQEDPVRFEADLRLSFERLGLDRPGSPGRIDLLAIHGINQPKHLDQALRPGGCLEVARRWQAQGRIGAIGFSTHGPLDLILEAIESDCFDFINLHWYLIRQDNAAAIAAAGRHDMGVFLISPTDKGGHLHTPSSACWSSVPPCTRSSSTTCFAWVRRGCTRSVWGRPGPVDFDLHLQAIALLPQSAVLVPPVLERLDAARRDRLGEAWLATWQQGLPAWQDTPGGINLPTLLWLHNLLQAWDLEAYGRARYGLLGSGGDWFPGANADALDDTVSEADLLAVLGESPWAEAIPPILRQLRDRLGGAPSQRLSSAA
jgi:predicted aldo/keto reductase-like oxidoreductase